VNLDTVRANVQNLKRYIGEKVHLMAVVKANGYGHGMIEIARTSISSGASWIGVATLDEAITLRSQLQTDTPILVLGYVPPQHLPLASRSRITVTCISLSWIQEAIQFVKEPLDFHLKIDTGLNRLGCRTIDEVRSVIDIVSLNPNLHFSGIFTHFASSEDMNNKTYFDRQLSLFDQFLQVIPEHSKKLVHCANSGATLYHGSKTFFDMVRCGKALMGPPNEPLKHLLPISLNPVFSAHSALDLVKKVDAGQKIGYVGEYTTNGSEWIGTVPIGYGDGWHQNFRKTGVLVNGKRMPIVGWIS
jgi:alanine racemase